jgi:hypothetical protein
LRGLVAAEMEARAAGLCDGERFDAIVDEVAARTRSPYAAADALLQS